MLLIIGFKINQVSHHYKKIENKKSLQNIN